MVTCGGCIGSLLSPICGPLEIGRKALSSESNKNVSIFVKLLGQKRVWSKYLENFMNRIKNDLEIQINIYTYVYIT